MSSKVAFSSSMRPRAAAYSAVVTCEPRSIQYCPYAVIWSPNSSRYLDEVVVCSGGLDGAEGVVGFEER